MFSHLLLLCLMSLPFWGTDSFSHHSVTSRLGVQFGTRPAECIPPFLSISLLIFWSPPVFPQNIVLHKLSCGLHHPILCQDIKIDLFHFEADLAPCLHLSTSRSSKFPSKPFRAELGQVEKHWTTGQEESLFKALSCLAQRRGKTRSQWVDGNVLGL